MPLPGGFKTDAADASDLAFGVAKLVHGHRLPVFGDGFVLAEVNAADQLSYNDKVNALFHNLGLQRRGRGQLRPDFRGAVVAVNAHTGAQAQKPFFRAQIPRNVVPLGAAHRAQENAVGSKALFQHFPGQRVAKPVDGAAAHVHIRVGKAVAVKLCDFVQDTHGLRHDLGADAVAADHRNFPVHGVTPLSGKPAARPFE